MLSASFRDSEGGRRAVGVGALGPVDDCSSTFLVDRAHVALTRELHSFVEEDLRAVERARHLGRDVQLDATRGDDVRFDTPALNDDRIHADPAADLCSFTDHEQLASIDLPFEAPIDAHAAGERDGASEAGSGAEESVELHGR